MFSARNQLYRRGSLAVPLPPFGEARNQPRRKSERAFLPSFLPSFHVQRERRPCARGPKMAIALCNRHGTCDASDYAYRLTLYEDSSSDVLFLSERASEEHFPCALMMACSTCVCGCARIANSASVLYLLLIYSPPVLQTLRAGRQSKHMRNATIVKLCLERARIAMEHTARPE